MPDVIIYTDGACRGNPGVGAAACLLICTKTRKARTASLYLPETTNNAMELQAICFALKGLTRKSVVEVRTDSMYAISALTKYIKNWKKNGWLTSKGKPVSHQRIIQAIDDLPHLVKYKHVKGHSGEPGNEYVDAICNQVMDGKQDARLIENSPYFEWRYDL